MRSIQRILAHPRTEEEQRRADQHIERVAAAIRKTWTEEEHRSRCTWLGVVPYETPFITLDREVRNELEQIK